MQYNVYRPSIGTRGVCSRGVNSAPVSSQIAQNCIFTKDNKVIKNRRGGHDKANNDKLVKLRDQLGS
jgi:hypothetical protein